MQLVQFLFYSGWPLLILRFQFIKQTDLLQLWTYLYTFVDKLPRNPGWGRLTGRFGDYASTVTAGAYSFPEKPFAKENTT